MKEAQFNKLIDKIEKSKIKDGLKEELLHTLEDLKNQKRYGLVWNREKVIEDVVLECEKRIPILEAVKENRITGDGNSEHNIFIEGDNYHALQVLNQTHAEKVDVIYIDPPYNTGNKDFIYNDKKIDIQDDYRHSKWLSFMEKRLKLAKNLLKETGVIFISIDDNEQANLKLLCDDIFGEENFVANLVWANKEGGGGGDSKHFKIKHEYILVYAKNKDKLVVSGVPIEDESRYNLEDEHVEERGRHQLVKLDSASLGYIESLDFPIKAPNGDDVFPNKNGERISRWRWSKNKVEWGIENDFIVIKKNSQNKWNVYTKQYLKVDNENQPFLRDKRQIGIIEKFSTTQSNRRIRDLFGKVVFQYSKPVDLIKLLLSITTCKNSIALDFMAGSGTTGHAVLALNKEDGGNRQFILCTNNENNNGNGHGGIAEGVCYPRIKKVIEGYNKNGNDERVEGLGGGLEYFKTDFVDVNVHTLTDGDKLRVSKKIGYILGIRHNCFKEKQLNEHYHILENGKESVFIYFEEDLRKFKEFKEYMKEKVGIMYSYSGGAKGRYGIDTEDFKGIRIEKIPEQFVAVYKNCIN